MLVNNLQHEIAPSFLSFHRNWTGFYQLFFETIHFNCLECQLFLSQCYFWWLAVFQYLAVYRFQQRSSELKSLLQFILLNISAAVFTYTLSILVENNVVWSLFYFFCDWNIQTLHVITSVLSLCQFLRFHFSLFIYNNNIVLICAKL